MLKGKSTCVFLYFTDSNILLKFDYLGSFFTNFVAFSEYVNFKTITKLTKIYIPKS